MSIRVSELPAPLPGAPPVRPRDPGGFALIPGGLRCLEPGLADLGQGTLLFAEIRVLSVFTSRPEDGSGSYLLIFLDGRADPLLVRAERLDFELLRIPPAPHVLHRLRLLARYLCHQAQDGVVDHGTYAFLREGPPPGIGESIGEHLRRVARLSMLPPVPTPPPAPSHRPAAQAPPAAAQPPPPSPQPSAPPAPSPPPLSPPAPPAAPATSHAAPGPAPPRPPSVAQAAPMAPPTPPPVQTESGTRAPAMAMEAEVASRASTGTPAADSDTPEAPKPMVAIAAAKADSGGWLGYPFRGKALLYLTAWALLAVAAFAWLDSRSPQWPAPSPFDALSSALGMADGPFAEPQPMKWLIRGALGLLLLAFTVPFSLHVIRLSVAGDGRMSSWPAFGKVAERIRELGAIAALSLLLALPDRGLDRLAEPLITASTDPTRLALAAPTLVFGYLLIASLGMLATGAAGSYGAPSLALRFDRHLLAFLLATGGVALAFLKLLLTALLAALAYLAVALLLPILGIYPPAHLLAGLAGLLAAYLLLSSARITGLLFRRRNELFEAVYGQGEAA
ncbi:MAG: hypothetical protein MI919_07680 [Holophagales bacterium]|nr:hypothetical protein [Holophagales bacterium]